MEEVDIKEDGITLKDEITLCKKGNNELMEGIITGGTQKNKKEQPMKKSSAAGLRTPCILNGEKFIAFVDGGASHSFIDVKWVTKQGLPIAPRRGVITQFIDRAEKPRIGVVEGLVLENGQHRIQVDFEVANLEGGEEMVIGMDLFKPLGFEIIGVLFTWPRIPEKPKEPEKENKMS